MASTPNFFLFSGLLFLAWFTADVHSVKVLPDRLKGSTVVLPPVEAVTPITSITWKHGANLAVEWFRGNPTFYNIFSDTCSLNTETGELTINNVRPEHSGVYTPDINLRTRSAVELRVLSPVPKPSITHDCVPGEFKCTLRCMHTCTLDNVGHVEVFWILDDRRVNGSELPITKDSKEETFICSVKNSVSSEISTKLLNPLLPGDTGVPVWKPVIGTLASLASIGLLAFVCWKWIYLKYKRNRIKKIIKEIQETMSVTVFQKEHDRIKNEMHAAGLVTEEDLKLDVNEVILGILREGSKIYLSEDKELKLLKADEVICRILKEGKERKLSKDNVEMLLTARYVILRTLKQGPEVKKSLENVKEIMEIYYEGRPELWVYADEEETLHDVCWIIWSILVRKQELKQYKDGLNRQNGRRSPTEEDQKLKDVLQSMLGILRDRNALDLPEDDFQELRNAQRTISKMLHNMTEKRKHEVRRRLLYGASNDTRDPAADPLISSPSGPEAEDKV